MSRSDGSADMPLITLQVVDGADRGNVFDSLHTPVTIGREEGNTVQLNDERVSRFHVKIQEDHDKLVLTDLESTNGTKVNGEDSQLRILRYGDMISLGRSVIVYGSRDQIAERLGSMRRDSPSSGTVDPKDVDSSPRRASLEFELNVGEDAPDADNTIHELIPPDLPERLSPAQAAQLIELLEYVSARIRRLINTVRIDGEPEHVTLDFRRWQDLLDLQSRLASYLRGIGDPEAQSYL